MGADTCRLGELMGVPEKQSEPGVNEKAWGVADGAEAGKTNREGQLG